MNIRDLNENDRRNVQQTLIYLGFLNPTLPNGRPADDGIWGPITDAAYQRYWQTTETPVWRDTANSVGISVPVVAPAPVRPWWLSRGVWGSILTLVAVGAGFVGMGFDADAATDALMPIVEAVPLVIAAIGAAISWWGRKNAKAPIDPTLVARIGGQDVRLPVRADTHAARRDPRGHFSD
ncbi:MAG: hypothetical protein EOM21_18635 [Gammaproteobacteria bacterium]|nr:hypothetical protein [Gammaproteobacteria bacterium]